MRMRVDLITFFAHWVYRKQSTLALLLADFYLDFTLLVISFFDHFAALPNLSLSILFPLKPLSFVV